MEMQEDIITTEEFAKVAQLDKFPLPGLATFLMELLRFTELNEAFIQVKHLEGIDFIDKLLEILQITIEVDEADIKNIPANGGFIALANHPYGGIEGLALLKILYQVRPEIKVMANFLLKRVQNISSFIIPVNPFGNHKYGSNLGSLKHSVRLLQQGIPLGIFPAGEVSSFQPGTFQLTDKTWHPVVGKLIVKANVPVLPVYFHGNNGLLFNLLGMVHPRLRTARLATELLNKKGYVLKLRIGRAIAPQCTMFNGHPEKLLAYFRARTYVLGAGLDLIPRILNAKKIFKIESYPKEIIPELPGSLIQNEINSARRQYCIYKEGSYEVFVTPALLIPNILREIGRLREITFRAVGEGTNKEVDLDRYDAYYRHLFIWDTHKLKIVGSYRIGNGKEIFSEIGKFGFYTAELFKINKEFSPVLQSSLELGRSWIRREYQQKALPLFLLWRGISIYLVQNPWCKYLIGPVSISNTFSKFSQSLMVDYIKSNCFDHDLAKLVKPRKKFRPDFSNLDKELLLADRSSLKSLDGLISEIETNNLKIPVMLRHYISLNAKIICFNIDPKFSNSLDGFVVVSVSDIPQNIISKLRPGLES